MKAKVLTPLLVFAALFLVACSQSPRLARQSDARMEIRMDYLRGNPGGEYNDHIAKGEVSRGMHLIEVLASWGLPSLRRGPDLTKHEYWTYYSRDEHTDQIVGYELSFDGGFLKGWAVDPNVAGIGLLTPRDLIPLPTSGITQIDPTTARRDFGSSSKKQ